MRKIVIAIDSFKGSLTSQEALQAVEEGIKSVCPLCEVVRFPIADGGEGILDVLVSSQHGTYVPVKAHDPLMQLTDTRYGLSGDGRTAYIEMAAVNGLPLVPVDKRNPLLTTTYGTGELIRDALERGCRDFIIGIGGSATNDAGLGMLQALGYRFLDRDMRELETGGRIMGEVAFIDSFSAASGLKESRFIIACDVDNPFCGPDGAACVFASQKGADEAMTKQLDHGMCLLAATILRITGVNISFVPGAGAAGGMGGAFLAFLNAKLMSGIDMLLDIFDFDRSITGADLIITGEGKIDRQTLMGKVPYGVLKAARKDNIPVIAIAGKTEDEDLLKDAGFKEIYSVTPTEMPLEQAMLPSRAKENIKRTVQKLF